jgi:formylglycine-generating enzyme required for sulfatase activity
MTKEQQPIAVDEAYIIRDNQFWYNDCSFADFVRDKAAIVVNISGLGIRTLEHAERGIDGRLTFSYKIPPVDQRWWKAHRGEAVRLELLSIENERVKPSTFPFHVARETEFYQGYIRFKMSVTNKSSSLIADVVLDFIFDEKLLNIADYGEYPVNNGKIILGNIYGGKSKSIAILFDPLTCTKAADINCHIIYADYEGRMASTFMKPKQISVICPIMKTESDINIGRLKEFIVNLPTKDSRVYEIKSGFNIDKLTSIAREVVEKYDVRHVRNLHTRDGKICEIWYYGNTKVTKDAIIIKISVSTEHSTMELFAATKNAETLTGLLAEIGRDLKNAVESKTSGKGGIINVTIKDSIVQRSNLLDLCDIDGTCDVNIVIEDSVVERTNIATVNEEVKHLHRKKEELGWQRREVEKRIVQETARLKIPKEKEITIKDAKRKRTHSDSSSQKVKSSSHSTQIQNLSPQKNSGKKVLISLLFILLLGGLWMGLGGSENSTTTNSQNMDDLDVFSFKNTVESDEDSTSSSLENAGNEYNTISYDVADFKTYTNSIGMEFVLTPAGEFMMGSPEDEEGRENNEGPVHKVTIENAYYLGKYEITREQWFEVMGDTSSNISKPNYPIVDISWYEIQNFIKKLNEKEETNKYRLPTETEWEYACRANTKTKYYFGDNENKLSGYTELLGGRYQVGRKKPNPWGLYDMHGNVWEWVQDDYHKNYVNAPNNAVAWKSKNSNFRVIRGGASGLLPNQYRSAVRTGEKPGSSYCNLGFRLVMEL